MREPLPTRADDAPPLPEAYERALTDGLLRAAIPLRPSARSAIDAHVRLLLAWNAAINLTAVRDPAEVAVRHVVDSLTAVDVLRERGVRSVLDLGSGGGFPGLPLAAALDVEGALLVDSVAKKVRFIETAAAAAGLADRVHPIAARAEALAVDPSHRERWPAVTARAVAGLAELAELALPLLEIGGVLVAWKRGDIAEEVAAARRAVPRMGGATIELVAADAAGLLPDHRLVLVTKRGPTPDEFPRDPAVRRRRPW